MSREGDCFQFLERGRCRYGNDCRFRHSSGESSSRRHNGHASVAAPGPTIVGPSEMFNVGGHGVGVYSGGGVMTKTEAKRTLFVTNIPSGCELSEVEKIFCERTGFVSFRSVRRMCFVDFEQVSHATAAMRELQGHKLPGGGEKGLAIDYDKDHVSKRNRNYEIQRRDAEREILEKTLTNYNCAACGAKALSIGQEKTLADLPVRGTDRSNVVQEDTLLYNLSVCRGESVAIRRAKGIERQWRLLCTQCELPLAYRPVPLDQKTKYLYVMADAVKMVIKRKRSEEDLDAEWDEAVEQLRGGGGSSSGEGGTASEKRQRTEEPTEPTEEGET